MAMTAICRNRKGIFFTSIAFLITTVLVLTFGTPRAVTMSDQLAATEAKAEAVNTQVNDLTEGYLPQSLYIATYSALQAMSYYLQLKGGYFTGADASANFNNTLKEMVVYGTMCCSVKGPPDWPSCNSDSKNDVADFSKHITADQCIGKQVMAGRNLSKRLFDMENISYNLLRLNTTFDRNYSKMVMVFFQDNRTGPWQLGVNLTINYSVSTGDVRQGNSKNISAIFGITGIPDPLYGVESQRTAQDWLQNYSNYFNATNLTAWGISSLYHEIDWRLYKYDGNGSSFLSRFYGTNEPSSCCGVESLINPYVMASVNGGVERAYVDWCYYIPSGQPDRCTPAAVGTLWNVTCVTNDTDNTKFYRFALDTYHALKYNISNGTFLYQLNPPSCPVSPFP